MHIKVFGYYDGPKEVMKTRANYTEINVISNYAACAPLTVTVTDTAGSPVEGATVEFKLYNYAEFYTESRKTSDARDQASLSAGLGDMLVMAVCDGRFGVRKVSFGREPQATVMLDHAIGDEFSFSIDIVPPAENANLPKVTGTRRAKNDRRFNGKDSIRNTYIATVPAKPAIAEFARSVGMKPDDVAEFIAASRGNHAKIMDFLRGASRQGGARRFRHRRESGTGDRTVETELCADSASRQSGVFPALLPFALRRAVVLPGELSRFRAVERTVPGSRQSGNRLLYARDGQPARQRQRAGERVVLQRPSGQHNRNGSDDARQFRGCPRDRELRLLIEIHRCRDGCRNVDPHDCGTRLFRDRITGHRAGTYGSCAKGHHRQGRGAGEEGTLADPALPRRGGAYRKYMASPAALLPGNVPLPVFLIGDTFNRVVFESHSYTISLDNRLLHTIHQL